MGGLKHNVLTINTWECSQTLMGVAFLWIPYGGALGLTTKQSCKQMWQKIFLNLVSIIFKQIVSVRGGGGGGGETSVISSLSNPLMFTGCGWCWSNWAR